MALTRPVEARKAAVRLLDSLNAKTKSLFEKDEHQRRLHVLYHDITTNLRDIRMMQEIRRNPSRTGSGKTSRGTQRSSCSFKEGQHPEKVNMNLKSRVTSANILVREITHVAEFIAAVEKVKVEYFVEMLLPNAFYTCNHCWRKSQLPPLQDLHNKLNWNVEWRTLKRRSSAETMTCC
ncbi:hypothetical protein Aduo_019978 [Ancylostoma duodenale]